MAYEVLNPDQVFPESAFVKVTNVPVFDTHKGRKTTKAGKKVEITSDILDEIATNNNRIFFERRLPTALTLGHTKEGADEREQPPIVGWAINFRTAPLLETGEQALYCDWYIKKKFEHVIEDYPHRSVEYWPGAKEVRPIALLSATVPERDLPVIRYGRPDHDTSAIHFQSQESSMDNPTDPNTMAAAFATSQPFTEVLQQVEGFAAKMVAQDQKIDALTQQLTGAMSVLGNIQQIMDALSDEYDQENPSDDPRDLLGPADPAPEPAPAAAAAPTDSSAPAPTQGDRSGPVRFDSSASGPNSGYVPGPVSKTKEKVQMQRDDDEAVQFQKAVDAEVTKRTAAAEREKKALLDRLAAAEENIVKFQRDARVMKAEKAITELETKHDVDFGDFRDNELAMLTELDDESFQYEFDRVQKYWRKKEKPLPNDGKEVEAVKFQRTDEKPLIASFEDSQRAIKEAAAKGLSYEQYVAKITAK